METRKLYTPWTPGIEDGEDEIIADTLAEDIINSLPESDIKVVMESTARRMEASWRPAYEILQKMDRYGQNYSVYLWFQRNKKSFPRKIKKLVQNDMLEIQDGKLYKKTRWGSIEKLPIDTSGVDPDMWKWPVVIPNDPRDQNMAAVINKVIEDNPELQVPFNKIARAMITGERICIST